MTTPEGPLVRLDGVTCSYDGAPVLVDVDLQVDDGQFIGIVGPSGSGKTTLLKALLGVEKPIAGSVYRRSGLGIGYVPQVETVDWSFPVTVTECVLMARTAGGRPRLPWPNKAEQAEVDDVLHRLGIAELADRHIRHLSGGQQQRVFIARALLGRPALLLLDEPTSGVDVATRHEFLHLLRDLNQPDLNQPHQRSDGLAILLTTHDLNGMAAHLPQVVCLNTEVIGAGPAREVLTVDVLERTYGARMEVLEHAGMPLIVERPLGNDAGVSALERPGA